MDQRQERKEKRKENEDEEVEDAAESLMAKQVISPTIYIIYQ